MARRFCGHGRTLVVSLCGLLCASGCGLLTTRPAAPATSETGIDGQPLLIDDIRAITGDMNLTDDEKRIALRDLGVVDADLIDALLTIQ